MIVRRFTENDEDRCAEIVDGLSDWFDKNEIEIIKNNFNTTPTYVCEKAGLVLGYISVKDKFTSTLEIESIGVDINNQGNGVGLELVRFVEDNIANGKIIVLKTLDESSNYAPYVKTREFYEKNGFVKVEVICPYPDWTDDSPCAIYVKMPNHVQI